MELAEKENHAMMLGAIAKLIGEIGDICDSIDNGWVEPTDVVADCFDEAASNIKSWATSATVFNFLYRLYWRLKKDPHKSKFNVVGKGEDFYTIDNYDYATFKWCKSLGVKIADNRTATIPFDKLTIKQRSALDQKIKETTK